MSEVSHNQFPMLRIVRRWESLPRQTSSPERWLGWARAVGVRYLRNAIGPQSLALVLVEQRSIIHSRIERWHHAAFTIRPRINLTLNSAVWSSNLNFVYSRESQALSSEPSSRSVVERGFRTLARNWTEKTFSFVQRLKETEINRHTEALPALTRVFTRSSQSHENLGVGTNHTFETPVARHSLALTRRVSDERSRIEDQVSRTLLTLKQQHETTKNVRRIEETVIHSASEFNSRSAERFGAPNRAPIDIEQLTDQVVRQIDNRMISYRERLGKVF
jgi:hypothetical protein